MSTASSDTPTDSPEPMPKVRRAPAPREAEVAPAAKTRRAPAPGAVAQNTGRGRFSGLFVLVLTLVVLSVGIGIGGLLQSRRQKAREVIVSVNGENIDQKLFYHRMEILSGSQVLQRMMLERLQTQFAASRHALPTKEELDRNFAVFQHGASYKTFQANGIPDQDIRNQLRIDMAQRRLATGDLPITEAEMKAFYQANINPHNPNSAFFHPESVKVQVIETQTEAQAVSALSELNSGAQWATVVDHYSVHPSRTNRGQLEPIYHVSSVKGEMADLQDVLFKMQPGDRLPLRKIHNGWWIIQCLNRKPAETDPYDAVRDECRAAIAQTPKYRAQFIQKQQEIEKAFTAFRTKSTIQPFWDQYRSLIQVFQSGGPSK